METIQVKAGTKIAAILKDVGCRKRKALVSIVNPGLYDTAPGWWDGGSQEEQCILRVYPGYGKMASGINVEDAPQITNPFQFSPAQGYPQVSIDDGQALLTVGTFCGKPRIPHIKCTQAYWEALQ